jgi:hypothetical protein
LIQAANAAGGKDNVTVLILEGEHFQGAPPVEAREGGHWWSSRPAVFVYGFALASAAAWLSRPMWQPAPVVLTPRVLTVGSGAPYATIREALETAREGDTVEVLGGEYREQVRLKNGVTVRSRAPRESILRASPVGNGPAVVAEQIKGARFSGFRILADAQMPLSAGVLLVNSEVELDDSEITGAGVGVEIRGAASPWLRANSIHNCTAEGILISGASQPWISQNTIVANGRAGLAAHDGARPALVGNLFDKNPVELPPDMKMDTVRELNHFPETRPPRAPRAPAAGNAGHPRAGTPEGRQP